VPKASSGRGQTERERPLGRSFFLPRASLPAATVRRRSRGASKANPHIHFFQEILMKKSATLDHACWRLPRCCRLLAGCASDSAIMGSGATVTASDKARMTHSGFLSDYARLKPAPGAEGAECWRDPKLDAKKYDKVLISRIVVSLVPPKRSRRAADHRSELTSRRSPTTSTTRWQGLEAADAGGRSGRTRGAGDAHRAH
jgi:hypothetical protein